MNRQPRRESLVRSKEWLLGSVFVVFLSLPVLAQAQSTPDQKNAAVNDELDVVEGSGEFSNYQPNAQKEFSTVPQPNAGREFPDAQEPATSSTSSRVMAKEFFDPTDLLSRHKPQPPTQVVTRINTFDLGYEIFYYQYREPTPGAFVTINGPMEGFDAGYTYRPPAPNIFNNILANVYSLQARYAISDDLEYKGSGVVKDKHDHVAEFRGLVGKDYFLGTNSRVTPYFGFGYRYLLDKGNGVLSSTGYYGYDRKSHYYYLPIGGDVAINMPHQWEVDLNAEYDFLIYGIQKSYLSDGDQFNPGVDNPNLVNNQHHGYGLRASIRLLKHAPGVDFYIEPYVRYWSIDQSKDVIANVDGSWQDLVEPDNDTLEVGSKFGIRF